MNNNSGGGNRRRPQNSRSNPNVRKPAGAAGKNNKQVQRPTPSPDNRAGRNTKPSNSALNSRRGQAAKQVRKSAPGKKSINRPQQSRTDQSKLTKTEKTAVGTEKKTVKTEKLSAPRALTPPKEPVKPYIRKMRRILLGATTILILVAICVGMSLTVFFKIDEITVEGKTRYDEEDIIAASMINKGDNLLLCDTSQGVEKIQKEFAYIENVDIEKKLFNKINIKVVEAKPSSVVENGGKYIVLSESGKIIEINNKNKYDDIPAILGADLKNVKLASKIQYKDANLKKYLDRIIDAIGKYKIHDIKTIDISNTASIKLIKGTGFEIIIGSFEEIEYKLETASNILSKNVRDNENGTLDVSLASPDGGKSYLKINNSNQNVSEKNSNKNTNSTSSGGGKNTNYTSNAATEESSKEESTGEESPDVSDDAQDDTDDYVSESYDDNTDDVYTDDGYTDDGYTDDGYTDDGYTDDGYTDDGYYDDGYTDDGYYDDGYTDDGYTEDYNY